MGLGGGEIRRTRSGDELRGTDSLFENLAKHGELVEYGPLGDDPSRRSSPVADAEDQKRFSGGGSPGKCVRVRTGGRPARKRCPVRRCRTAGRQRGPGRFGDCRTRAAWPRSVPRWPRGRSTARRATDAAPRRVRSGPSAWARRLNPTAWRGIRPPGRSRSSPTRPLPAALLPSAARPVRYVRLRPPSSRGPPGRSVRPGGAPPRWVRSRVGGPVRGCRASATPG